MPPSGQKTTTVICKHPAQSLQILGVSCPAKSNVLVQHSEMYQHPSIHGHSLFWVFKGRSRGSGKMEHNGAWGIFLLGILSVPFMGGLCCGKGVTHPRIIGWMLQPKATGIVCSSAQPAKAVADADWRWRDVWQCPAEQHSGEAAAAPTKFHHLYSTPCPQSSYPASRPCWRQRRQQLDIAVTC